MKHFLYLLLAASVLLCGGCSSEKPNLNVITEKKTETSTLNATSGKNVALVMKTLTNPFFIEMEKGARRGAKEFGVNLLVRTGAQETSITQQIEIIDELIRDKVDAIVIARSSFTRPWGQGRSASCRPASRRRRAGHEATRCGRKALRR